MEHQLKPEQLWDVLIRAAEEADHAGRHEESLGLLQQASRMAALAFGDSHQSYGITLLRLGDACAEIHRYDDAEKYYLEAITIVERALGDKHLSLGIGYRNLAEIYEKLGDKQKAADAKEKAIQILKGHHPKE